MEPHEKLNLVTRTRFDEPDAEQLFSTTQLGKFTPNRRRNIENYLGEQSMGHLDDVNWIAKELHDTEKPLAHTVVLIPVAAHQEAKNIERALSQYAKQTTPEPFTIALYPNMPYHLDETAADATFDALTRSREQFPSIDLRYTSLDTFAEPIIGKIRKNLWDAVILLAYYEQVYGEPRNEIIAINHDIDTVSMSPRYIQRIQTHYARQQKTLDRLNLSDSTLNPTMTTIKYAPDETRPNLSRAMFWNDLSRRQLGNLAREDAGIVMPLSYYAKKRGFDPKARLSEALSITSEDITRRIPQTNLETDSRRYADRLHSVDYDQVWSHDTFGASDNCRVSPLDDISQERLHKLIRTTFDKTLPSFFLKILERFWVGDRPYDTQEAEEKLHQTLLKKRRLALSVLQRIDTSGKLSDSADKRINIDDIVTSAKRHQVPDILQTL